MRTRNTFMIGGCCCFFTLVAVAAAAAAATDSIDYLPYKRYDYFRARLNETVDPCENFYDFSCSKFDGMYKNISNDVSVSSTMLLDALRHAQFSRKLGVKKRRAAECRDKSNILNFCSLAYARYSSIRNKDGRIVFSRHDAAPHSNVHRRSRKRISSSEYSLKA